MDPKYEIGQKVIIKPVTDQPLSHRESDIELYTGQIGEIANYHWISPRTSQIFYIYTIKLSNDFKELVLYEDEIEPCFS